MSILAILGLKEAAAAPAPAAGAPAAGAAPAAPAAPPPNPVKAPTVAPAGAAPNGGFTVQLPKTEHTVDQTGKPIDANGNPLPLGPDGKPLPVDPSTGKVIPPGKGGAGGGGAPTKTFDPDSAVAKQPGQFLMGLNDRLDSMKFATSPEFLGDLDHTSPTGRTMFQRHTAPGMLAPDSKLQGLYGMGRKVLLDPLLRRSKTPFGGVSDRNSRFGAPIYEGAAQVNSISGQKPPGLALVANWLGGLAGRAFDNPGIQDTTNSAVQKGISAWQNATNR